MFKKLPIRSDHQKLITAFVHYLRILGYAENSRATLAVKELCSRIEQQDKSLVQLNVQDLQEHYLYLCQRPNKIKPGGLSLSSIRAHINILKLFFNYLQKRNLIDGNPTSGLILPKTYYAPRQVLTPLQIKQLYDACLSLQERAILGLYYGCGLRRCEGQLLNLKDIDYRSACLFVRKGKGKRRRVVPLTQSVLMDLNNYRFNQRPLQESRHTKAADRNAFMLNKIGTRLKGDAIRVYFKAILNRTSINPNISLHHLRHSIATHLLAGGMTIEQVRDFLGHQYLESTQIYTRVSSKMIKSVVHDHL